MPYQMNFEKLRANFNRPYRNLSLQYVVDSLNFENFMVHYEIYNRKECICSIDEYFNGFTPQLVDESHTESNNIKYLLSSVLGKK